MALRSPTAWPLLLPSRALCIIREHCASPGHNAEQDIDRLMSLCVYIIHIIIDLTATAVKFFSDYSSNKIVLFISFKSGRNFLISKVICLEDSKIFFLIDLTVRTACFYREIGRIVRALYYDDIYVEC